MPKSRAQEICTKLFDGIAQIMADADKPIPPYPPGSDGSAMADHLLAHLQATMGGQANNAAKASPAISHPVPNRRFVFDISNLQADTPVWVVGTVETYTESTDECMIRLDETLTDGCFHGADLVSFKWSVFAKIGRVKPYVSKRMPTFGELENGLQVMVRVSAVGKFIRATVVVAGKKKFIKFSKPIFGQEEMGIDILKWARLCKMGLARMPKRDTTPTTP